MDEPVEAFRALEPRGKVLHFELVAAVETSVLPHLPTPPCVIVEHSLIHRDIIAGAQCGYKKSKGPSDQAAQFVC
jgi:hypothetical protein